MASSAPTLKIGQFAFPLDAEVVSIGREDDNNVILDDASVSGHHALVEQIDGVHVIRDLGSTNGTRVNGVPVMEATLSEGDQISLGSVDAVFNAENVSAVEPTGPAQAPSKSGTLNETRIINPSWRAYTPLTLCVVGLGTILPLFVISSSRHLAESGFVPVFILAAAGCAFSCLAFLHLLMPMSLKKDIWGSMGLMFITVAAFTSLLYLPLVDILIPKLQEQKVHVGGKYMFLAWVWQEILGVITWGRANEDGDSARRFLASFFGTAIPEELTKVAPATLLAFGVTLRDSETRKSFILAAFFGGLGFGTAEALMAYSPWGINNVTEWNWNVLRWFRSVPLHGVWAAISATLIWEKIPLIKATENRWIRIGYFVMCLGFASAIHASNNTFNDGLIFVGIPVLSVWVLARYAFSTRAEEGPDEIVQIVPRQIGWIRLSTQDATARFIKGAGLCIAAIGISGIFASNKQPQMKAGSINFPTQSGPERCIWCGGAGGGTQPGFGWIRCNHCGGRGY